MNNIDICITLKATRSLKVKVLMFANLSGVTFATIGLMFCIVLLDSPMAPPASCTCWDPAAAAHLRR